MKKYNNLFAGLLALSLALPVAAQAAPASPADVASDNVERLAGGDRTKTAIEVSKKAFAANSADSIVLVGYHGEVDALAGTLLANDKGAPVLIAGAKELSTAVKEEIDRLGAKNVYILGGEAAVNKKIEQELKDKKLTVNRISGVNRAGTAAKVAKEVKGKASNKVFLVSGDDRHLVDGLAIGPVSAQEKAPVLLVDSNKKVSKETLEAITDLGVKEIEFIGGENAISDSIKEQFSTVKFDRTAGSNRENTALEIASKYFTDSSQAIISYGWKSADALAGGYLAAKEDAPILLSNKETISLETLKYLEDHTDFAYVLGGSMVISESVLNKIVALLGVDPSELTLTILGTTDLHGNIYNWSYENGKEANNIGMAKVASLVDEVRAENPNTLLIDNGDAIQGTILTDDIYNKDLSKNHPVIDAMNFMGYDSMTLGNHEFNYGREMIEKINKEADFPILTTNTKYKDSNSNLLEPSTVVEVGGIKVGIIGLVTPHVPRWDGPTVKDLKFENMADAATEAIKDLKKNANPDIIIATAHANFDEDHGGDSAKEIVEKNPEIAAMLIGHEHVTVVKDINGTPVGAARDKGAEVVRFDLSLAKNNDEWEVKNSKVKVIETKGYEPSEKLKKHTEKYHKAALSFLEEVLGQASADFVPEPEIKGIPEAQIRDTALIDFINKVQLDATKADVAAAGLFDLDSNLAKGDLTYADIFKIYKYSNTLMGIEVTGKQLKEFMEFSAGYYNQYVDGDVTISFNPKIRGYSYAMFEGVDYKVDVSKAVGERIQDLSFNGKPIADDQTLKLAINNHTYGTLVGEGIIPGDQEAYFESDPKSLRSFIADAIKEAGTINPTTNNNWEIVGVNLDHPLRKYIVDGVNNGEIKLPTPEDGRTYNVKSLNVYELIKDGTISKEVLDQHGLDAQGNKK